MNSRLYPANQLLMFFGRTSLSSVVFRGCDSCNPARITFLFSPRYGQDRDSSPRNLTSRFQLPRLRMLTFFTTRHRNICRHSTLEVRAQSGLKSPIPNIPP